MNSGVYFLNNIGITNIRIPALQPELERLLSSSGICSQIITFNTHFLRISCSDSSFSNICRIGELVLADGIGIVLLLRLKYRQKIERITGSDLFNACLEIADRKSLRIALVGSSAETLFLLSEEIRIKWPSVILLTLSPEYEFEKSPELNNRIVNDVKSFSPHILLVALGCPRQEKWIFSHKDYIGAKINIGVGAVFDFYSGTKKRAPLFLQSIGMEWFWRLLREPVRLGKRYLVKDLPFFIITLFRIMFKLESKRAEQI